MRKVQNAGMGLAKFAKVKFYDCVAQLFFLALFQELELLILLPIICSVVLLLQNETDAFLKERALWGRGL